MHRLPAVFIAIFGFSCLHTSAGISLMAITHPGKPLVTLQWNMVSYPGTTAYTLFKSTDGVVWEVTATNPVFRNYTASTILAYRDNFANEQKLYYKVKIYDANENIVDISNTAVVANPKNYSTVEKPPAERSHAERAPHETASEPVAAGKAQWQLFPNPVGDMLNLSYTGKAVIKGVINILVLDGSGKEIIHFRAASNNKQVHVPVSNLHTGVYFLKVNVNNELQLNEKFAKE